MTLKGEEVFRIGYPKESPYYKLDAEGKPATKFSPTNVAIAPNGDIYVADGTVRITSTSTIRRAILSAASEAPGRNPGSYRTRTA